MAISYVEGALPPTSLAMIVGFTAVTWWSDRYFGLKPNADREPDDVNEGKEAGYLAEKFCSSPSAWQLLLVPSLPQTEENYSDIFQTDLLSTNAKNDLLCRCIVDHSGKCLTHWTKHFLWLTYFKIQLSLCLLTEYHNCCQNLYHTPWIWPVMCVLQMHSSDSKELIIFNDD